MKRLNFKLTVALATIVLAMTASQTHAESWRINSDPTKGAHFASINDAMASSDVAEDDTLYLDPGTVLPSQTISKRIVLIGTGYHSTAHNIAYIAADLIVTASNTKIEGVYVKGALTLNNASYLTVERCRITDAIKNNNTSQYATFRQCWVGTGVHGAGTSDTRTIGWTIENCITLVNENQCTINGLLNPTISNNVLIHTYTAGAIKCIDGITGGKIENNIIIRNSNNLIGNLSNCTVQNNVLVCPSNTWGGTYPDNVCLDKDYNTAMAEIFTCSGEDLNYYQLKDDSPAKGAGVAGIDCGIFSGNYPYVLYGYPYGMPYLTMSQVAGRATDGQVKIKQTVKIQND